MHSLRRVPKKTESVPEGAEVGDRFRSHLLVSTALRRVSVHSQSSRTSASTRTVTEACPFRKEWETLMKPHPRAPYIKYTVQAQELDPRSAVREAVFIIDL